MEKLNHFKIKSPIVAYRLVSNELNIDNKEYLLFEYIPSNAIENFRKEMNFFLKYFLDVFPQLSYMTIEVMELSIVFNCEFNELYDYQETKKIQNEIQVRLIDVLPSVYSRYFQYEKKFYEFLLVFEVQNFRN